MYLELSRSLILRRDKLGVKLAFLFLKTTIFPVIKELTFFVDDIILPGEI